MRRLFAKDLRLTLLFAQVSDARSLRGLEAVLESQSARRDRAGLPKPRRATLADATATRPAAVFTGLLSALIGRATRKRRQGVGDCLRLIDSTSIPLALLPCLTP